MIHKAQCIIIRSYAVAIGRPEDFDPRECSPIHRTWVSSCPKYAHVALNRVTPNRMCANIALLNQLTGPKEVTLSRHPFRTRARIEILAALILLLSIVPVAQAAPGDLDPGFGGDGKVQVDFSVDDVANDMVVDGHGRIVLVGYAYNPSSRTFDYGVVRLKTDGVLDTTFSGDGKVWVDAGYGVWDYANAVALDGEGRILVGATTISPNSHIFSAARLNTDGSLDTGFNGDGTTQFIFGFLSVANDIAVDSDGRIVLSGPVHNGGDYDFGVARLMPNGLLDETFDGDGKALLDFGFPDASTAMLVDSTGRIVVVGTVTNAGNSDFGVARLNGDGSPDTSFDLDGKTLVDFGPADDGQGIALDSQGRLVIAGVANNGAGNDFAVARLNADGSLDTSFASGGRALIDFGGNDSAFAVTVDAAGRIIVAGSSDTGTGAEFAVARLNADGALDTTFTESGLARVNVGASGTAFAVAVDGAGRILLAGDGYEGSERNFAVARLIGGDAPPDVTPPVIASNVTGTPGHNAWYVSDVTVEWTVTDDESTISASSGCAPTSLTTDTADATLTCTATSAGGNVCTSVTIMRDATPPGIIWEGGPIVGGSYYFGLAPAAPSCTATDATSGQAGCDITGYTTAVGSQVVTATAHDVAGNQTTEQRTFTVLPWTIRGFHKPVDMNGVWNVAKSGSTVPLKFDVFAGVNELTEVAVVDSFAVKSMACPVTGYVADDIGFITTGGTALRYDGKTGQFVQNWQTPRKPGACCQVTVTTYDGSQRSALFKLK